MQTAKTILVVDDDKDFLFQQRIQLEAAGFRVIEATSHEKARQLVEGGDFDLAMVDLMMEEMDAGFVLCREIKQKHPEVPVIMITAVARETGIRFDSQSTGKQDWIQADAVLAKPVRFEQLTPRDQPPVERLKYVETLQILVCDDEIGMRLGVRRALQHFTMDVPELGGLSFNVRDAESGEQCLDMIAAQRPDVLLLDHKLPGISGLDVLDRIQGQQNDMLTIMITAYASIEAAVRATKQGAYDFLPKPFTPAELRNAIQKAARHFILERQARQLAEEKRRVRFQFISVLAHELKAPINAVDGYLKIMQSGIGEDNPKMRSEIIERCSSRIGGMRKLIDDLLDLTRIESGQRPRELALIQVDDVARRACETVMPQAEARGINLELKADAPLSFMADISELEIIFNNLISNAVKYNRDGGSVRVDIASEGGVVTLTVQDTGIGLTEEESARLFKDFVRIRNEKTQDILGSGLGLSIVKKLALLYGGDVTVSSVPDVGSTFKVTLRDGGAA